MSFLHDNRPENCYKDKKLNHYDEWMTSRINGAPPSPYHAYFSTTFPYNTLLYDKVNQGMMEAEYMFVESLLEDIKKQNIPGVIAEFGVGGGSWMKRLDDILDKIGLRRPLLGFDSFEGLPEVDAVADYDCWKKGDFAADYKTVYEYLNCAKKPHIKLYKGLFNHLFQMDEIQNIKEFSFVRIDSDLYQSAKECLDFLKGRLSDKSILIFDDWAFDIDIGETKAFREFLPTSGYNFEFLALNSRVHLYLKAHKNL
jgi:hypothetical protein